VTAVTFTRRGDEFAVTFRYDRAVVELIKSVVPHYARRWVPNRREWPIEDVWSQPVGRRAARRRASRHRARRTTLRHVFRQEQSA
jgi:hypothetical protein